MEKKTEATTWGLGFIASIVAGLRGLGFVEIV